MRKNEHDVGENHRKTTAGVIVRYTNEFVLYRARKW